MEGFWFCKQLDVVFHRILEPSTDGQQFSADEYRQSVLLPRKDATNIHLLEQSVTSCWNSATFCPVALVCTALESKAPVLLVYVFKEGIELLSEVTGILMRPIASASSICGRNGCCISNGPCILYCNNSSLSLFCCETRNLQTIPLKQSCDCTISRSWQVNASSEESISSDVVHLLVKQIHQASCVKFQREWGNDQCTVSSIVIEHDRTQHRERNGSCFRLLSSFPDFHLPPGYVPVVSVIQQFSSASVDEEDGLPICTDFILLGTETKQIVLCKAGTVCDFALLADVPSRISVSAMSTYQAIGVVTRSGQGVVFVTSADNQLQLTRTWENVEYLAFGDFQRNGGVSVLVVFRNNGDEVPEFLVETHISVAQKSDHLLKKPASLTTQNSKGYQQALTATELLIARQRLILEDLSRKLLARKAQLSQATSLLQSMNKPPVTEKVWHRYDPDELTTTIGLTLSGEWFGRSPLLTLVPLSSDDVISGHTHAFHHCIDHESFASAHRSNSSSLGNTGDGHKIGRNNNSQTKSTKSQQSDKSTLFKGKGKMDTTSRCPISNWSSVPVLSSGSVPDPSSSSVPLPIGNSEEALQLCMPSHPVPRWTTLCATTEDVLPGSTVAAVLQWSGSAGGGGCREARSAVVGTVVISGGNAASCRNGGLDLDGWNENAQEPYSVQELDITAI